MYPPSWRGGYYKGGAQVKRDNMKDKGNARTHHHAKQAAVTTVRGRSKLSKKSISEDIGKRLL